MVNQLLDLTALNCLIKAISLRDEWLAEESPLKDGLVVSEGVESELAPVAAHPRIAHSAEGQSVDR